MYLVWNKSGGEGGLAAGTYLMPLATRESRYLNAQTGFLFGSKARLGAAPDDRMDILWVTDDEIRYACMDVTED